MKTSTKIGLVVISSIAAASLAAWFALRGGDEQQAIAEKDQAKTAIREKLTKAATTGKKRKTTAIAEAVPKAPRKAAQPDEAPDEDDEASLSSLQKSVLAELQDAVDNHSLAAVRKALAKFQSCAAGGGGPSRSGGERGGGSGNVPRCMKRSAVSALNLFGKDAIPDLIDFMTDADGEICEDAFDKFETALQDEMSDAERSALLKTALSAISDPDRIDSLLVNLNDMGNAVKADTIKAILQTGTDAAKSRMNERLDIYTDESVKTMADIDRWAAENPD